jgi:O-antigen/teichoic acid export membrane protein
MTAIDASQPAEAVATDVATAPTPAGAGLARGLAIYGVTTFGIRAINFLLIALYTRFLVPGDWGVVTIAETIAAVWVVFSGAALDGAMRRLYFQYVSDEALLRRYVSSTLRFALLCTAVALAAAFLLGPLLLGKGRLGVTFYPFVGLAIGTAAMTQLAEYRLGLFQVQARPRAYASLAWTQFALTAAGVIFFVIVVHGGARGMLLGKFAGGVVATAIVAVLIWPWLRGGWEWRLAHETLKLALPLMPHQLIALGLVALDRFILVHYRGVGEVGVYSLAYTLGMVMYLVTSSVSLAWSPIFYDLARQERREEIARLNSRIIGALIAIASIGALIAPDFVRYALAPGYRAAGTLAPWIIGGYLLHALFSLCQLSLLHAKRTDILWTLSLLALALNIGLNFWWIPRWGAMGAAYATAAAYGLEAVVVWIYAQRVFRLPYALGRVLLELCLFGVCLVFSQGLLPLPQALGARAAILAAVFFLVMLVLWRDSDVVRMLWRRRAEKETR